MFRALFFFFLSKRCNPAYGVIPHGKSALLSHTAPYIQQKCISQDISKVESYEVLYEKTWYA